MNFPEVARTRVHCEHIGLETLVYDNRTHKAFCLNQVAAAVWKLADGTRTPARIAEEASARLALPISLDAVLAALEQFASDGLLEQASPVAPVLLDASRREALRKVGLGAAMLVPVVAAVMAPRAAQAYNGCFDCSSGSAAARAMAKKKQQQGGTVAPSGSNESSSTDEKPDPDEPHEEYAPQ